MCPISVVIIAKNAQKTIRECLLKLQEFDEVILLDNLSEDQTIEIAKSFENVKIFQSEFIGFGALKNLAISYATNDWILSLDSDEILEDELLEEIKKLKLEQGKYYSFLRKNLYAGEWIKGCGWHPNRVKRIFNRSDILFKNDLVHEGLDIPQGLKEIKLSGFAKHYTTENIDSIIAKMNIYTTLSAKTKKDEGKKGSFFGALLRFVFVFVKDYFFRFGWRYGYKGFVIAWCNANGAMFRYLKLYEMDKSSK